METSIGMTLTNKETKNYFDGIKLITSSRKLSVLKIDVNHNRRFLTEYFMEILLIMRG